MKATQRLTKKPIYTSLYKRPGKFSVTITENVTPTVRVINEIFRPTIRKVMEEYGQTIKEAVRKSYLEAPTRVDRNKDSTILLKGGSRVLKDSGAVENMVMDTGGIEVKDIGDSVQLDISWDIPPADNTGVAPQYRKMKNFMYLFVHEGIKPENPESGNNSFTMRRLAIPTQTGFKILTKEWQSKPRPFFIDGIKNGIEEGKEVAVARLAAVTNPNITEDLIKSTSSTGGYLHYDAFEFRFTPTMIPSTVIPLILYFTPPTRLLGYVGLAYDLAGVWEGTFTEKMIYGYMRQMAWGQSGITGKAARRKFRRRLWNR